MYVLVILSSFFCTWCRCAHVDRYDQPIKIKNKCTPLLPFSQGSAENSVSSRLRVPTPLSPSRPIETSCYLDYQLSIPASLSPPPKYHFYSFLFKIYQPRSKNPISSISQFQPTIIFPMESSRSKAIKAYSFLLTRHPRAYIRCLDANLEEMYAKDWGERACVWLVRRRPRGAVRVKESQNRTFYHLAYWPHGGAWLEGVVDYAGRFTSVEVSQIDFSFSFLQKGENFGHLCLWACTFPLKCTHGIAIKPRKARKTNLSLSSLSSFFLSFFLAAAMYPPFPTQNPCTCTLYMHTPLRFLLLLHPMCIASSIYHRDFLLFPSPPFYAYNLKM